MVILSVLWQLSNYVLILCRLLKSGDCYIYRVNARRGLCILLMMSALASVAVVVGKDGVWNMSVANNLDRAVVVI